MTPSEARSIAFDKSYAAHLAHIANTGDATELQQEADDWYQLANILQATKQPQREVDGNERNQSH